MWTPGDCDKIYMCNVIPRVTTKSYKAIHAEFLSVY